ncbi:uncharacterized protein LOC119579355 [Penaeus monodon]|uniref:uncharacterized protein LOC119579355 n=1 Tax=Penaeus monodon TaxID=6687 RepID=UPI0018A7A706|nr:uncharacterized protein LOC119579355 [Penaeus monodon]
MGACMTRCWPLYPDPSYDITHNTYQPVRSRYLRQDDTVQLELIDTEEAQPRRTFSLTTSIGALLARLRPKGCDLERWLAALGHARRSWLPPVPHRARIPPNDLA